MVSMVDITRPLMGATIVILLVLLIISCSQPSGVVSGCPFYAPDHELELPIPNPNVKGIVTYRDLVDSYANYEKDLNNANIKLDGLSQYKKGYNSAIMLSN